METHDNSAAKSYSEGKFRKVQRIAKAAMEMSSETHRHECSGWDLLVFRHKVAS